MVVHGKRMRNKAKGYALLRSLKRFHGHGVENTIPGRINDTRAWRLCQGTRKKDPDGFCHRSVFHGDEVVNCSVLKGIKLRAGKRLGPKAVSDRVLWCDKKPQAATARLQKKPKCYKGQATPRSSAVCSERKKMIRDIKLAPMAVVVERAALRSLK